MRGKTRGEFSKRFFLLFAAPRRVSTSLACEGAEVFMGASLTWFLIFCNGLSSEPFPFDRLNPIATRRKEVAPSNPLSRDALRARSFRPNATKLWQA
jgi:hypothetical protein